MNPLKSRCGVLLFPFDHLKGSEIHEGHPGPPVLLNPQVKRGPVRFWMEPIGVLVAARMAYLSISGDYPSLHPCMGKDRQLGKYVRWIVLNSRRGESGLALWQSTSLGAARVRT